MFTESRIHRSNGAPETYCENSLFGFDLAMSPMISPQGVLREAIFGGKYIRLGLEVVLPDEIIAGFELDRKRETVEVLFGSDFCDLDPDAKVAVHASLATRMSHSGDKKITLNLDAEKWDAELREILAAQLDGITVSEYRQLLGGDR